ncbi:MAG: 6-phospho-beta-glucosidase [Christensenellaceae bacterium]|jgi:6-phospho-beta-glucosidase|nr:6-phospho-beta-glucosidase [Christensenellaceae bacterium]
MKLTVIGGGGVRSMFLAKSIAKRASYLSITEVVFMDIDNERLDVYGALSKKIFELKAPEVKFSLTLNIDSALKDADYVITTIRAGGDLMRARDERIALRCRVLGQETVGAAGFSFAMRSIPVLVDYCQKIKNLSKPNCKVFNFTNPAGLVSQGLYDAGFNFAFGICDAPSGMLKNFSNIMGKEVNGECYGLNHLSFFNNVYSDGKDVTRLILESSNIIMNSDLRYFNPNLLKRNGFIPNEYLYYYYYPEKALFNIIRSGKSRGEIILDLNIKMTRELKEEHVKNNFDESIKVFSKWYGKREKAYMANETGMARKKKWSFDIESDNDGGYADIALKYIELELTDNGGDMILCVPNKNKAIMQLDDDDIIEVSCSVTKTSCIPHKIHEIPDVNLQLIKQVKLYERLASKAILNADFDLAVDALYVNPMVGSYALADELATKYFEHNKNYLITRLK